MCAVHSAVAPWISPFLLGPEVADALEGAGPGEHGPRDSVLGGEDEDPNLLAVPNTGRDSVARRAALF